MPVSSALFHPLYLLLFPSVLVPGKECEIVIFKGSQILGLAVTGGTDSYLGGIYVQKVLADSPAARDGRLQPGDRILKVRELAAWVAPKGFWCFSEFRMPVGSYMYCV